MKKPLRIALATVFTSMFMASVCSASVLSWFAGVISSDGGQAADGATAWRLDDGTVSCMSCHDGSVASHVTAKSAGSPIQIAGFQTTNHPVGMRYSKHAARDPGGYRSPAVLDDRIVLVDGVVSCVSCHALREPGEPDLSGGSDWSDKYGCTASGKLTLGRKTSDLCLTCHIK